jgi:hypothetical protein
MVGKPKTCINRYLGDLGRGGDCCYWCCLKTIIGFG